MSRFNELRVRLSWYMADLLFWTEFHYKENRRASFSSMHAVMRAEDEMWCAAIGIAKTKILIGEDLLSL